MTHDEMIAVIQAQKDGKPIQRRFNGAGSFPWEDFKVGDYWNFTDWDYRINPEEKKPMEIVVEIHGNKINYTLPSWPESKQGKVIFREVME